MSLGVGFLELAAEPAAELPVLKSISLAVSLGAAASEDSVDLANSFSSSL